MVRILQSMELTIGMLYNWYSRRWNVFSIRGIMEDIINVAFMMSGWNFIKS